MAHISSRPQKVLVAHKMGVHSLAYNDECRLLVSAGFDYDPIVWNPYASTLS